MTKVLMVATEVQKVIFEEVLLGEIATGFWKNMRPSDHADAWQEVSVVVGLSPLGVSGFDIPRKYNFVNPDFFKKVEKRLLEVAQRVNPNITIKQLKKQLLMLNIIIDGRQTTVNGPVTKLSRGKKCEAVKTAASTTVRKAPATIIDSTEEAA
jgi:hypothetical protein